MTSLRKWIQCFTFSIALFSPQLAHSATWREYHKSELDICKVNLESISHTSSRIINAETECKTLWGDDNSSVRINVIAICDKGAIRKKLFDMDILVLRQSNGEWWNDIELVNENGRSFYSEYFLANRDKENRNLFSALCE